MAITTTRISSPALGTWTPLGSERTASIFDIAIQNLGTADVWVSNSPSDTATTAPFKVAAGQIVSLEGLTTADLATLYVTDFGAGTEVGIIEISR